MGGIHSESGDTVPDVTMILGAAPAPTDILVIKERASIRDRVRALLEFESRNDEGSKNMAETVKGDILRTLVQLWMQVDWLYTLSRIYARLRDEDTPESNRIRQCIDEYVATFYPGRIRQVRYLFSIDGQRMPQEGYDASGSPTFRTLQGEILSVKAAVDMMTANLQ